MHWRLLAFFPLAALMALISLASASSFVFALEKSLPIEPVQPLAIERIESDCGAMRYAIREMSRRATGCDADLHCLGTPVLCPITMDAGFAREYHELQRTIDERCQPSAPRRGLSEGGILVASGECRSAPDHVDRRPSSTDPRRATFVF